MAQIRDTVHQAADFLCTQKFSLGIWAAMLWSHQCSIHCNSNHVAAAQASGPWCRRPVFFNLFCITDHFMP